MVTSMLLWIVYLQVILKDYVCTMFLILLFMHLFVVLLQYNEVDCLSSVARHCGRSEEEGWRERWT